ncbi:hypothetical protein, partial [Collinsella aerofaciens]
RACWLKWVGRDWSISADYIWLNYSGANSTWVHSLFGALGTGYFAPIMSCGEIGTAKPLKRPKQSVFHRNFKTLMQINLSPMHQFRTR